MEEEVVRTISAPPGLPRKLSAVPDGVSPGRCRPSDDIYQYWRLVAVPACGDNRYMDWKPWQGEATLEAARWLTNRLRQGDDPPSFARLRRALQGWGLDPEQSVLSELFPDGGSDFGILIRPDGVPC